MSLRRLQQCVEFSLCHTHEEIASLCGSVPCGRALVHPSHFVNKVLQIFSKDFTHCMMCTLARLILPTLRSEVDILHVILPTVYSIYNTRISVKLFHFRSLG